MSEKKDKMKKIIVIFVVSVVLRVGYVSLFRQAEISGDAMEYDTIGYNVSRGLGYSMVPNVPTAVRAPFYPFMLGLIYLIFGHSYIAVKIVQAILGTVTCILIYYIAKSIFNETIGMISALLLGVYPVSVVYSGLILTETFFTFLFVLTIFFSLKTINIDNLFYPILSGGLLGITTLTRSTTILFPFVLFLILFVAKTRKWFVKSLVILLAFVVALLPWTIRNYRNFNVFLPVCAVGGISAFATGYMTYGYEWGEGIERATEKWENFKNSDRFLMGIDPTIEFDKQLKKEAVQMIKSNLKNYLLLVVKRLPKFWWTSHSSVFGVDKPISEYLQERNYLHLFVRLGLLGLHAIFLILALVGIILSSKKWQDYLILILILIYFTGHIAFDPCPRYHIPAMPFLFIFVARGIIYAYEHLRKV